MLAIKFYKILNGLSPNIMPDISECKTNYHNTRSELVFYSRNIKAD